MRECPFPDCGKHIADDKFACAPHWFSLSKEQQARIWDGYRAYQCGTIDLEHLRLIQGEVVTEAKRSESPTQCKSCNAPVRYVPSAVSSSLVCLNAEPDPVKGNFAIVDGKAKVVKKSDLFDGQDAGPLYLSHHATCPASAQYRKAKK